MASYKGRGIILRRDNFGEADRCVTIYTDRLGKIVLLAKGARRPTAKLTGAVNLFNEIDFVAAEGRNIDILTEAQVVVSRDNFGKDLAKIRAAYWVSELVDKIVQSNEPHPELYYLIHCVLGAVARRNSDLILSYFIYQCLDILGYRPELKHCTACGKALAAGGAMYFSSPAGGVVADCCADVGGRPIGRDAIKAMRFLGSSFDAVQKLKIPVNVQRELHTHLKDFAEYISQKKMKSEELATLD